jgi:hypothetical protein
LPPLFIEMQMTMNSEKQGRFNHHDTHATQTDTQRHIKPRTTWALSSVG